METKIADSQLDRQLKEQIPNYFRMLEAIDQLRQEVETQAALPIPTNPKELEAELQYWAAIASGMPEQVRKVVEVRVRADRVLLRRKREILRAIATQ